MANGSSGDLVGGHAKGTNPLGVEVGLQVALYYCDMMTCPEVPNGPFKERRLACTRCRHQIEYGYPLLIEQTAVRSSDLLIGSQNIGLDGYAIHSALSVSESRSIYSSWSSSPETIFTGSPHFGHSKQTFRTGSGTGPHVAH